MICKTSFKCLSSLHQILNAAQCCMVVCPVTVPQQAVCRTRADPVSTVGSSIHTRIAS